MRHRIWSSLLLALVAFVAVGCEEADPVVRVGTNAVEKSMFQGSWYMTRTVVDVDYEAAGIGTFPGDTANDPAGGSYGAVPRIRWVIDENFLYAYRDYEFLAGIDGETDAPGEHLGQPVAAYRILSHFDIKRQYNTTTGEEQNVIEENALDRRWYEREFMRVDWSQDVLPTYYGITANLYEIVGMYKREPVPMFIQNQSDFPDSWQPRFDRMPCANDTDTNCKPYERDLADQYAQDELYHMSFVTQELLSPGDVPDPFSGQPINWCVSIYSDAPGCTANAVFVRTSFLKVSDKRQYEPVNWTNARFDRHGYFRLEGRTFDRSNAPDDPAFGETDFLNYNVNRHNIWKNWYTEDANGTRTPVPYAEREVRPIVWYTTPELPAHLVQPSFDLVGQWNQVFMQTVRQARGKALPEYPRVDCQSDDPGGYCYCRRDPTNPDAILNETCEGQYDPFQKPEDAANAGVVDPYDCYVAVPEGAEPDLGNNSVTDRDFYKWYGAEMRGSECVNVLRINTCDRATVEAHGGSTADLDCEERGDARFKFLSYVDQPGTDFLGIATLRGDPVSGETRFGDANIGGPALDGYRTSALQQYDLLAGNISEAEIATGEDIRQYLQNVNHVLLPSEPREDYFPGSWDPTPTPSAGIGAAALRMDRAMVERLNRLKGQEGRSNIFSDRMRQLAGSDTERRLTSNMEFVALAGMQGVPAGVDVSNMPDSFRNYVSPFRISPMQMIANNEDLELRMGELNVHMPNEYVDNSIAYWIRQHYDLGWNRAKIEFQVNRLLYRQTQVHEMGHCLGLRHDFGGTTDVKNYHDDYYLVNQRFPMPNATTFDTNSDGNLNATEAAAYRTAYTTAKRNRELAGIDGLANSSIMDYTANWYERLEPSGYYDHAAIAFAYGDLVELGDNNDGETIASSNPINTPRLQAHYYQGGEICEQDSDCPYAADGARASELLSSNGDSGFTQHCVQLAGAVAKTCSNFDDDVQAAAGNSASPRWIPTTYRFCTDERAAGMTPTPGTIGWCNRFDEGDSYREIVANMAESYERMYVFANFRRYRNNWGGGYVSDQLISRRFAILMNIYQSLVFEYTSNPEFRNDTGPFGFNDEFLATADIINLFARILASPDVGGYNWNAAWGRYESATENPDPNRSQLGLPVGLGRYFQTTYETGLTGIKRIDRIGMFYDKYWAINLLTARGWQDAYTKDVPFYTNFYDLFPREVKQIFSGLIQDEPEMYMPRVECGDGSSGFTCRNPNLVYMDFYRGDCSEGESSPTCRPPSNERYSSLRTVNGGNSIFLQEVGAMLALSEFPVFFDTSFQNELYVCTEGASDCRTPAPGSVEGTDYIRYSSERIGRTYIAWQIQDDQAEDSIGFSMVKSAKETDFILTTLRKYIAGGLLTSALTTDELNGLTALNYTLPTSTVVANTEVQRLYRRLTELETTFAWLQQVQREMGVSTYLGF